VIDFNQLSRRNLTDSQRELIIGRRYNREKKKQGGTGTNQYIKQQSAQNEHSAKLASAQNEHLPKFNPFNTPGRGPIVIESDQLFDQKGKEIKPLVLVPRK